MPAGADIDPAVFASVMGRAHADPTGLPELELCGDLARNRLLTLDAETIRLLAEHRWLTHFEFGRAAPSPTDLERLLHRVPPRLLRSHAGSLATGLLAVDDPVQARQLAEGMPTPVTLAYLHALRTDGCLPSGLAAGRVAVIFSLLHRSQHWWGVLGEGMWQELDKIVRAWSRTAPKEALERVAALLSPLGEEFVSFWRQQISGKKKKKRFRFLPQVVWPAQPRRRGRPDW